MRLVYRWRFPSFPVGYWGASRPWHLIDVSEFVGGKEGLGEAGPGLGLGEASVLALLNVLQALVGELLGWGVAYGDQVRLLYALGIIKTIHLEQALGELVGVVLDQRAVEPEEG